MSETNENKKAVKSIERVTVSDALKPKLQLLCDQANESLQGMASITKSDIVNLLLAAHSGALSKSEVESLRSAHFDEVRFAQWMANRLKRARNTGESVSLMELIERGKDLVEGPRERAPRRTRKRKEVGAQATAGLSENESETT